jgi:transposase
MAAAAELLEMARHLVALVRVDPSPGAVNSVPHVAELFARVTSTRPLAANLGLAPRPCRHGG